MKVLRGLQNASMGASGVAAAIGTFDGVHLGHRLLLESCTAAAKENDLVSAVVTWDRHPSVTVAPDEVPPLLTSTDRKLELMEEIGLDVVVVLPFDSDFASWSPERFVEEVLAGALSAREVFVGSDFRFGQKASGDATRLTELGHLRRFEVRALDLMQMNDEKVSSTAIRAAIAAGEVEAAATSLARPYDVDGVVVRGDGRGAGLGYPTANLEIDPLLARPAQGVYSGRIRVQGAWHRAAVNVGKNLTFGGEVIRVEAYILDFEGDIYGEEVRLEFWLRLRDELKFDSVPALIEQMDRDVEDTRARIALDV